MEQNFTSQYLNFLKKEGLIDEIISGATNNPVDTITFSKTQDSFSFPQPNLIYSKNNREEIEPYIIELDYQAKKLKELGLEIISRRIKKKWKKGQTVEYKLRKKSFFDDEYIEILKGIPANHKVRIDKANGKAKLVGPNCRNKLNIKGETDWIYFQGQKREYKKNIEDDFSLPDISLTKPKPLKMAIKDIPIMVGLDGSIVCIPHRHEPNNIAVVGSKGTGKTLILNRLASEILWNWKEAPIIINDIQQECEVWSEPLENIEWANHLKLIDEKPFASPIIYIYPHTSDLKLDYNELKSQINFVETTLPFSEVINKAEIYLKLEKDKGTIRYIWGMKEELLGCETPGEVTSLIEEKYDQRKYETMKNKMVVSFENVFNDEILNITNKEYPCFLESGDFKGNPFVVLAKIGLIPCFETYDLNNKRYMPEVISYHLESIFESKFRGKILEGKTVYIIFDELTHICSDDNKNSAYDSVCKLYTRGRKLGIGNVCATQNYSKIPRKVKNNIDFVFAFKHSSEEEVTLIKKDYDLKDIDKDEIFNLESFEVLGITNEYFNCYKNGEINKKKVVQGKIIFPMSNHMAPL